MIHVITLLISLVVILFSAELFTNAVEWLGKQLNLNEGAVGSVLAAVGTAMPETMIPIIAILFGGGEHKEEIGIGAILGAPFMLSTLALLISGIAVLIFTSRKRRGAVLKLDRAIVMRDLGFFLGVYTVAILAGIVPFRTARALISIGLIAAYGTYLYLTVFRPQPRETSGNEEESQLRPLTFAKRSNNPAVPIILLQVAVALTGIVLGAEFFVEGVTKISEALGVSAFVLSVIIAPIATELPEKFNSVIWLGQNKDTLALGNITGAMVFQSSVIPALGIMMTPWTLEPLQMANGILAILSAGLVFLTFKFRGRLAPINLLFGGLFYLAFIAYVFIGVV